MTIFRKSPGVFMPVLMTLFMSCHHVTYAVSVVLLVLSSMVLWINLFYSISLSFVHSLSNWSDHVIWPKHAYFLLLKSNKTTSSYHYYRFGNSIFPATLSCLYTCCTCSIVSHCHYPVTLLRTRQHGHAMGVPNTNRRSCGVPYPLTCFIRSQRHPCCNDCVNPYRLFCGTTRN